MDSSSSNVTMYECRVSFHDRSHLKIIDSKTSGTKTPEEITLQSFIACYIELSKNQLNFFATLNAKTPFAILQPINMTLDMDRNNQYLEGANFE